MKLALADANALLVCGFLKLVCSFDTRSVAARPRLRVESLRNFYIQNIVGIFLGIVMLCTYLVRVAASQNQIKLGVS